MSDSSDDMEFYSGFVDGEDDDFYDEEFSTLNQLAPRVKEVLLYCEPHLHKMWAAKIASILLGCDFKDIEQHLAAFKLDTGIEKD